MFPEQWRRIKKVLNTVLDAPEEERERVLHELCRDDPVLHQDVHALLHAGEPDLPEKPLIERFKF